MSSAVAHYGFYEQQKKIPAHDVAKVWNVLETLRGREGHNLIAVKGDKTLQPTTNKTRLQRIDSGAWYCIFNWKRY
jgi:hypothetical protein